MTSRLTPPPIITHAAWIAEATRLFGADPLGWRFKCPVCKHVACVKDWKDAGASEGAVAFSCVGRWLPKAEKAFDGKKVTVGPCDYAGGGLFRLNPVRVDHDGTIHEVFEFAEAA